MTMTESDRLYSEYRRWETLRGHTEQGLTCALRDARKVFGWLTSAGIDPRRVGISQALEFSRWLGATGKLDGGSYSAESLVHFHKGAMHVFDYLKSIGLVMTNPFRAIPSPRPPKYLPKDLPIEDEMLTLLSDLERFDQEPELAGSGTSCQPMRPRHFRWVMNRYLVHVVGELQYASGLRIAEVADLTPEDIDLDRGIITVHEGKGGDSRYAYLHERSCVILRIFRDRIRPMLFTLRNWQQGHRLFGYRPQGLAELVNRVLNESAPQMGKMRCTSHGFRHCLGYHLLRAGCPIRYIQDLLGHKSIRSTEIYTKVDQGMLKKTLDTVHPRQWRKLKVST